MREAPFVVVAFGALLACSPGPSAEAECTAASECEPAVATCAGCPDQAATLCAEGACVPRETDAVDVRADVNLHRDVAPSVRSFVHVLVGSKTATGSFRCASAFEGGRVASDANVLASGYKAVDGGSFHEGVNVGRVPEGDVALLIVATSENAGEGDVLATGCAEGISAVAPAVDLGLVQVVP